MIHKFHQISIHLSTHMKQTTKWIWAFGIALAVVITVEYFELPIFSGLSFLLSGVRENYFSYGGDKSSKASSYLGLNISIINNDVAIGKDNGTKIDHLASKNGSSSTNSTEKTWKNASIIVDKKKPKMESFSVMSISEMNQLLQKSRFSRHSVASRSSSRVNQQLIEAKSQIENAGPTNGDPLLYTPLYRNVSMFKRSYEMMEQMLKVYIYKDGEKPIFHNWMLKGVYASEGWFLKLMEENQQFVTQDPNEAHLFYLPFSSKLLQSTLYVPSSPNIENLIEFVKNYTQTLITKYPYWNRTNGSDHFLTACHDWAPAETKGRLVNTMKALCNADIQQGFEIGKDVSLPTTLVSSPKDPLHYVGGEPPSERPILAFFAGRMHGYLQPILLAHWGNDTDMRIFGRMPKVKGNKDYINFMKTSKYCICAKGFAVHSPRVVESLHYNCVPVIISDNYVPPLFEVLNWESFAVFVLEKDVPNLKKVLLSISHEKYVEMYERVKKVREHFFWHSKPIKYDLFHMILHSVWYNRVLGTNLS